MTTITPETIKTASPEQINAIYQQLATQMVKQVITRVAVIVAVELLARRFIKTD